MYSLVQFIRDIGIIEEKEKEEEKEKKKSDLRNGAFRRHLGNGSDDEYCIYVYKSARQSSCVLLT